MDKGKIRSIGVSNFNPHHLDELLEYARIRPVVNQIEIEPYMTQHDVVGYTFRKGIQVEACGRQAVLPDNTRQPDTERGKCKNHRYEISPTPERKSKGHPEEGRTTDLRVSLFSCGRRQNHNGFRLMRLL